jgi:hypothetical protein
MLATAFLGPATTAFKALRWLHRFQEDDQEMAELLADAVTVAIDPKAVPGRAGEDVQAAAEAIARQLDRTKFPEPAPNVAERAASRVGLGGKVGRRRKQRRVNQPHPAELLRQWLDRAVRQGDVPDALAKVVREGRKVTPKDVVDRFRAGFDRALVRGPISDFRAALIEDFAQRELSERYLERLRRAVQAGAAGGATVGAVAGELVDLSGVNGIESAIIGASIGMVAAGAGAVIARTRRGWTRRTVARDAALRLVGEVVRPADPLPPDPRLLVGAVRGVFESEASDDPKDVAAAKELCDGLRDLLVPDAAAAADEELAAVLQQLDDRLRRWCRTPTSAVVRASLAESLLTVIEVAADGYAGADGVDPAASDEQGAEPRVEAAAAPAST